MTRTSAKTARSGPLRGVRAAVLGDAATVDFASLLLLNLGATVRIDPGKAADTALRSYLREAFDGSVSVGSPNLATVDVVVHHFSHCDVRCQMDAIGKPHGRCDIEPFEDGSVNAGTPIGGRAIDALSGLMTAAHAFDSPRPVFNPMQITAVGTALIAVAGAQLAYLQSCRSSRVEAMRVSELNGALLFMAMSAIFPEKGENVAAQRVQDPARAAAPTNRCFHTADGSILFAAVSSAAWAKAATVLNRIDLLIDPRYEDVPWGITAEADGHLIAEIEKTMVTRSTQEWVQSFREVGIPVTPVLDVADFRNVEHLRLSGTLSGDTERPHIEIVKVSERPEDAAAALPSGAQTTGSRVGPLKGLKIVEVATFAAAPCAAASLADYGATVTKIEMPPHGDPYREQGLAFSYANRYKDCERLDLKSSTARDTFVNAVRTADVFVLNNRLTSARKLGLDFESIVKINPRIVYCSLSAWGAGGPLENEGGVDPMFQAVSGMAKISGGGTGDLRLIPSGGLDMHASMLAVNGILAALIRREAVDRAQNVEASLAGAALLLVLEPMLGITKAGSVPDRNPVGFTAVDRIYATQDSWLYLHVDGHAGWRQLIDAVGRDEWSAQYTHPWNHSTGSILAEELTALFKERPRGYWLDLLPGPGITVVPVHSVRDLRDGAGGKTLGLFRRHVDELWGPLWFLSPFASPVASCTTPNSPDLDH